jgi:hypothetical protein
MMESPLAALQNVLFATAAGMLACSVIVVEKR